MMNRQTHATNVNTGNRPAEADELNFENDAPTPGFEEQEILPKNDPAVRKAGLTEASQPGKGPTDDDLTQETLILEDGARSQYEDERGNLEPADKALSIVRDTEIGAGGGLDEAELANVDPAGKKNPERKK